MKVFRGKKSVASLRNVLAAVVGLVGIAATAQESSANTVTAYLNSVGPYTTNLNISFDGGATKEYNAYVGGINWTIVNWDPGSAPAPQMQMFCIEGTENVYLNKTATWNFGEAASLSEVPKPWTSLTGLTGMGATKAAYIEEFWNKNYNSAWAINTSTSDVNLNVGAAAFQLGIWEIVYDGLTDGFYGGITANNLATGKFEVLNGTSGSQKAQVDAAVAMLNKLTGTYTKTTSVGAISGNGVQDQIFGTSVPLPAALPASLALLGVVGLVRFVNRRKMA